MRILAFWLMLATPIFAQSHTELPPVITDILTKAEAECIDEVAAIDANAPKPELIIEHGAITWTDLDGDGGVNDTVIDFNMILCSGSFGLWHNTGGSILYFVLNGEIVQDWTGANWRVTEFQGGPLILIARHGTWCGSFGARPCVQAIIADEGEFLTVLVPEEEG